ncbi:MAG: hypothetical protein GX963_08045 [Bacteroidales bacterium]|nr:hypothetical protein [Bacteroidales bacterium]
MSNGRFGFNKQYKRFRHRGIDKVQMGFGLFAMAFNLQKLIRNVSDGFLQAFYAQKSVLSEIISLILLDFFKKISKTAGNSFSQPLAA